MAESQIIDKDKRVSLEGLQVVYDHIKNNLLGGLIFSITEDGLLNIDDSMIIKNTEV